MKKSKPRILTRIRGLLFFMIRLDDLIFKVARLATSIIGTSLKYQELVLYLWIEADQKVSRRSHFGEGSARHGQSGAQWLPNVASMPPP